MLYKAMWTLNTYIVCSIQQIGITTRQNNEPAGDQHSSRQATRKLHECYNHSMEVNKYSGTQLTKKEFGYIGSAVEMKKYENARKVLPADTTYALVVEVVERMPD